MVKFALVGDTSNLTDTAENANHINTKRMTNIIADNALKTLPDRVIFFLTGFNI